jgi:hypothetical protein
MLRRELLVEVEHDHIVVRVTARAMRYAITGWQARLALALGTWALIKAVQDLGEQPIKPAE